MQILTARQLKEWELYCNVEPFGEEHFLTGVIASTLININSKKGSKFIKPEDCMPRLIKERAKIKSWKDMKETLSGLSIIKKKKENKKDG